MTNKRKALLCIGQACKAYREDLGIKQSQVAKETGYSEQNISSFENGRTNNMIIFLWYLHQGISPHYIKTLYRGGIKN